MAIPPVVVEFLARGVPDIARAFKTLQQVVEQGEKVQTRAGEVGARARIRAASTEVKERERQYKILVKQTEKWQQEETRAAQRAAQTRAKEVAKSAADEVKATQKAEDAKLKAVEKSNQAMRRIRERSATMAGAYYEREARKEQAARDRATSRERSRQELVNRHAREEFGRQIAGSAGRAFSSTYRTVGRGAQLLGGMITQVGGGFSVADSVNREKDLRHRAALLSASTILTRAGQKGSTQGVAVSTDQMVALGKNVGLQYGVEADDVLRGVETIKKLTGNVSQAAKTVPYVAKLASATGGDIGEMSGLAANILASNPNMSQKDLERQLRVFTRQGAVGGVEVADVARTGAQLTAAANKYGGDKSQNLAVMGAMAQIARQYGGASTARQATLSVQRFSDDVASHAKQLKKNLGIDVSDKHGNLRSSQDILMEMIEKTGGDVTKLSKTGLGTRGVKVLEGVSAIYKDAGGGEAGKEAVKREFNKYVEGSTEEEVDKASERVLSEPGKKLEVAFQQLRIAVGEQLLPEFTKLVPVIIEAIPSIKKFLDVMVKITEWALKNPFAGVAALFVTFFMKELAAARIGTIIQASLQGGRNGGGPMGMPGGGGYGSMPAGMGQGVTPGPGPGGSGVSFAQLGVIGVAQGFQAAAYERVYSEGYSKQVESGTERGSQLREMMSGSPEERRKAQAEVAATRREADNNPAALGYVDMATKGLGALTGGVFGLWNAFGGNDMATKGITKTMFGGEGTSTGEQGQKAIKANATLAEFDKVVANTTNSMRNLDAVLKQTGSGGGSSVDTTTRTQDITKRTSK